MFSSVTTSPQVADFGLSALHTLASGEDTSASTPSIAPTAIATPVPSAPGVPARPPPPPPAQHVTVGGETLPVLPKCRVGTSLNPRSSKPGFFVLVIPRCVESG